MPATVLDTTIYSYVQTADQTMTSLIRACDWLLVYVYEYVLVYMHVCVCTSTRQLIICCKAAKSPSPNPICMNSFQLKKLTPLFLVVHADDLIHSNECLTWVC
jgi:hypothetical protein